MYSSYEKNGRLYIQQKVYRLATASFFFYHGATAPPVGQGLLTMDDS